MRMKPLFKGAISVATIFVILSRRSSCGGREETTNIVKIAVASSVREQMIDALPITTFDCKISENNVRNRKKRHTIAAAYINSAKSCQIRSSHVKL